MHALATEADPVAELHAELTARGIAVEVDGVDLKVRGRTGALTPELRSAIQRHKHDLLTALNGYAPLDEAIIRDTVRKHTLDEIRTSVAILRASVAEYPDWSRQRQVLIDWRSILRAKEGGDPEDEWPGNWGPDWPWSEREESPCAG